MRLPFVSRRAYVLLHAELNALQRVHKRCDERPRKPQVGDTVEFIVGGWWKGRVSYIQTGIVDDSTDDDPKRPFKEYGYIHVTTRDKKGAVVAMHIVYPRDVFRVSKTRFAAGSRKKGKDDR